MTEKDIAELLRMNFALYKLGAKPLTDAELSAVQKVWYWHFKGYDSETIKTAFLMANRVCTFPVQPADIFDQLKQAKKQNAIPAELQWQALKAACKKVEECDYMRICPKVIGIDANGKPIKDNGQSGKQKAFESLPQAAKQYVGSLNGLSDLARFGEDELERYKKPEFVRVANEISEALPKRIGMQQKAINAGDDNDMGMHSKA